MMGMAIRDERWTLKKGESRVTCVLVPCVHGEGKTLGTGLAFWHVPMVRVGSMIGDGTHSSMGVHL
jgi:hypothetical protein